MNPRLALTLLLTLPAPAARAVDYVGDILPIMKEHCWNCHSNEKEVKGNLALDDFDEMRDYQVGKFSLIRPGNPAESQFLEVMKLGEGDKDFMPRKGAALPNEKLALIEKWIAEGAVIDAEKPSEKELAFLKDGSSGSAKDPKLEFLKWTNKEGKEIEARFMRLSDTAVTLMMKSGKAYDVTFDKLSDESVALAKKLGGKP